MAKELDPPLEKDRNFIFSAKITLRNGKVLYAKQCGIKAFKIPVSADNDNTKKAS